MIKKVAAPTDSELELLRRTLTDIEKHGDAVFFKMYETMFQQNPEYREIFQNTNMTKQVQMFRFIVMLAPNLLDDDLSFTHNHLKKIGKIHKKSCIKPVHFIAMKIALVTVLDEMINLNTEELIAWEKLMDYMAYRMMEDD